MILTVTLNTAIDHIIKIPSFLPGETIRSTRSYISIGGKGTDASYILGTLGFDNIATGFYAGVFGQKMLSLLHERGVSTDFVEVDGETRISTIVIPEMGDQTSLTVDTLEISKDHLEALSVKYASLLSQAGCVVMGGTPPKSVSLTDYREFIQLANAKALPTVVDASGASLRAALDSSPTVVKPNRAELGSLVEGEIQSVDDAVTAGRQILAEYGTAVVVTLGEDGAVALWHDRTLRIHPLEVPVENTAGAGDAVLAGIAHALDQGLDIEDGLRLGFGAAAAVMTTPRTADCKPRDVERFSDAIRISSV